MVDTGAKIDSILELIEQGKYFTINRARQYGKTTTLRLLEQALLAKGTIAARISFEGIDDEFFETSEAFCSSILDQIATVLERKSIPNAEAWRNDSIDSFKSLAAYIALMCQNKKVVLIIDEVDKTSNNFIFLKFLGMLRESYLRRDDVPTFQSVILAGVYDIKNVKIKLINSGQYQLQDGEKRINSPWNIAIDFKVDMSFSTLEIATMLNEYEADYHTGMDIESISKELRYYTNGYPFLVSKLCLIIHEDLEKDWTVSGVQNAVKELIYSTNTLFDDLSKNLQSYPELKQIMYDIIIDGKVFDYNSMNTIIELGLTFGFLMRKGNFVIVGNKIFETILYNYFIQMEQIKGILPEDISSGVLEDGKLNMRLCLEKFAQHYYELYSSQNEKFLEKECRLLFLTYLKPFLNGKGFAVVESETRNSERTDILVLFGKEQFIVELKIWRGDNAHEKAYRQLAGYLESKAKDTGYLLTFDFRKNRSDSFSAEWVDYENKRIFDVVAV
ncbi:hypothetical protein AGMMS49938_11310 [Fibrobacterales bacterium]|nr:hypothetical protein AGMMS49938_11310 [Fibrobacterales bacterium]